MTADKLTLDCPTTGTHWQLVTGRLAAIQGHMDGWWRPSGPEAPLRWTRQTEGIESWARYEWDCGDHTHTLDGPRSKDQTPCLWCGDNARGSSWQAPPRGHVYGGGPMGMVHPCTCCGAKGSHDVDSPDARCLHFNDPEVVAAREARQAAARLG